MFNYLIQIYKIISYISIFFINKINYSKIYDMNEMNDQI
jgi:hypothetical protein